MSYTEGFFRVETRVFRVVCSSRPRCTRTDNTWLRWIGARSLKTWQVLETDTVPHQHQKIVGKLAKLSPAFRSSSPRPLRRVAPGPRLLQLARAFFFGPNSTIIRRRVRVRHRDANGPLLFAIQLKCRLVLRSGWRGAWPESCFLDCQ